MDVTQIFKLLGISLGLGLLIGLQRETAESKLAGLRTFPLVTLYGSISALLAQAFGGWVVAAGFVSIVGVVIIGNVAKLKLGLAGPGLTTEVAMLLMYALGAYVIVGHAVVAVAVAGGVVVLLHFREQLHGAADRLGEKDLKAIMQFALISLVILPVLPRETYGPFAVFNPFEIWLMVVLIVGISLAGYLVYKFFGQNAGTALGGILGGLISSTATTVSYARRSEGAPGSARLAAVVIMIASTVALARVLVEIAAVARGFLRVAAPPLLIMLAVMAALSAVLWFRGGDGDEQMPEQENPSQFKSALAFGLLYLGVLFAVAVAKEYFGDRGLYAVAAISGLTDVDAITLSTSQLVNKERLDAESGWKLIMIAAMSNLVFKGGAVAALGSRGLFGRIALLFGLTLAVGTVLLIFWSGILSFLTSR